MSRVRRLGIRGIRNFGPGEDNEEIKMIYFSHPLTLILGPNGTGKTTIIECLKYATTGEFPPGSGTGKSNSFIHDPLLTNECSVKGLVKAEIVDVKGDIVTVSRRIECTQKKFVKKFQTLDSTLSRVNKRTGEKVAISHRCADVDLEMGLALGVSKPIMNYVIFCHQEDSTWPLEDGKKLKERFDQIFDSDKYNKAIEKIRKHNTKLKADLRVTKTEKASLEIIRGEAHEKKKNLEKFENRLANSRQKVAEITVAMEALVEKLTDLRNTEMCYMKLHTEKETKKTEYGLMNQQITELKDNIKTVYEGSADSLGKDIAAFDNILASMEDEMGIMKNKLKNINTEENKLKCIIGEQQVSIGKLKQQANAHEKNIVRRNHILNEMLTQWDLAGIPSEVTEAEASALLAQLNDKLSDMEVSLRNLALEQQTIEIQLQKKLDESRDQKSGLESKLIMLKKQIAEKRKEASRLRGQVDEVKVDSSNSELVDAELQEANALVNSLTASSDVEAMKRDIEENIKNCNQMELNLDKVNADVKLLQQESSLHAELHLLKSNLTAKEKDIQKLKNKHQDTLKSLLKVEVLPESDLKRSLNGVQERFTDHIKKLHHELQQKQREVTSLDTTRKHHERELQEKNAELETIQDEITSMCHGKDYDDVLLHAKKTVQDLQESRGMYAYKSKAYQDYIQQTDSCCPLCHRDFGNQQDIDEFKSELMQEVNKYPNQLRTCESQLKGQQKRYDALLQLKPLVNKVKQLQNDSLEKLKHDLGQVKQKLSECHTRIETLQLEVIQPESDLAQCKDIVGDVALWDQYSAEVIRLNQSIARVKASLPVRITDKSMQEAQAEQESIRKSINSVRKRIEVLRSSISTHNDKLHNAKEVRNKLTEKQLKMTADRLKLKQLEDKLRDVCSEESSLQESVQRLQQELGPVQQLLCENINLLKKAKEEHNETLENKRSVITKKSRNIHDLQAIQTEIDTCIRSRVVDSLRTSESNMKNYQKKMEELETDRADVSTNIAEIVDRISKQESHKRDLNDNMILKQKTVAAETLKTEITELKQKLGGMSYRNLMEEKKKLTEEEQVLVQRRNVEQGCQGEVEHNIKLLKKDLNKDIYRCADKNFMSKCAEIAIQEEAINDLIAYTTALDKAIIEYHEERMTSVNKIILNLWDLIYKGNDTTAIQIQTEFTDGMGDKRRTYNYKVVQEKQKVTMDMKGRCSAGQKVLASIIIRMALAETFAKSCGIFALDEPTTNLDDTNMKSLAQALATIVNIRSKHQKNFQLIVISHDENFVSQLTKVNKIKKVYELYRNDIGLTEVKVWCIEGNAMATNGSDNKDSSDEEVDAEAEARLRKRKKIVEEKKRTVETSLNVCPPRKKRITKDDDQ